MNNEGYTLLEVLIVMVLLSFVLLLGFNVMKLNTQYVYKGTVGYINRSNYVDLLYSLTKDIQSADKVEILDGGKKLKITYLGDNEDIYEIVENSLLYNGKDILSIKGGEFSKVKVDYFTRNDDQGNIEDKYVEGAELNSSVGVSLILQRGNQKHSLRDLHLNTVINVRNMSRVIEGSSEDG